jgi:hypothetical protein
MSDTPKLIVGDLGLDIIQDQDQQNPLTEWDVVGAAPCWHRNYKLGTEQPKESPQEYLDRLARDADPELEDLESRLTDADNYLYAGVHERDSKTVYRHPRLFASAQALVGRRREQAMEKYLIVDLYLYDHSGLRISTGSFNDTFDSGKVGFWHISLEQAWKEWGTGDLDPDWDAPSSGPGQADGTPISVRERAERYIKGMVETYNQYLQGDVWGFVAYRRKPGPPTEWNEPEWEELDSCWGFFGSDPRENGMAEHLDAEFGELLKAWDDEYLTYIS